MKHNKKLLFATVAYAAFAANGALAFDEVNWTWDSAVTSEINHVANITIDATPSGLTQVENIQTQVGEVTATSIVTGIENNTPGTGNGTITIDEVVTVSASYVDPDGAGNTSMATSGSVLNDPESQIEASFIESQLSEQENGFNAITDVQLTGEVTLDEIEGISDAADLPMIESAATAVGNNYAVDSTVSMALHSEQTLESNSTAISDVSDILNSAVNSSATAVGNNMSATLADADAGDEIVIADITQMSGAAVSASSTVTDVTLENYTGFGAANMGALAETQIPVISSTATAVGNNLAISVGGITPAPTL